jgi:spore germination protein KB
MKLTNLLPTFEIKPMDFIHSVQIMLAIPFLEILTFLMIIPYTSNKMKVRKPVLLGLCMSTALLIIVVIRDVAVLGLRLNIVSSPSFSAIRQIDIANILTRLDILLAITLLITIFMKVTVFYYVTVLGLAQLLKLRSYIPVTIPIGAIAMAIAARLYESDMEQIYSGIYVWPFYANINEIVIPLITLIVIAIRRLPKKQGEKCK